MKVLHVMETPGQGSGRHVIDLAAGMRGRGHDVHVVYSAVRANPDFQRELLELRGPGLAVEQIAMHRRPGLADIGSFLRLRAYIRAHGPFDVIHGHSSKAGALARLAALGSSALRLYTPNAFVTLDPLLRPLERRIYGMLERCLGWISDAVIAVSNEECAEALALGIAERRVHVIYSGIKLPVIHPRQTARERLGLADEEICIGFVGRLARQKAPERLLASFAAAAAEVPGLRLLIIGHGDLAEALREIAAALAIGDRIIWTGEVPSAEYFAAIDVFVLPSRFEGLSYSTMEAMGVGIPVIATDAGGARTLVADRTTGFIIPQQADESRLCADIGAAIAALASDPELRRAMGAAALERSRGFEAPRMVREVLELYARLRLEHVRRPLTLRAWRSRAF
jgi:glycosyltransferase involved in cell wall biosynthesis